MKNTYLDYKIYVTPEKRQISELVIGENQKHVIVGYNDAENTELVAFLEKIMNAAKLNLKTDCLILKGDNTIPSLSQLSSEYTIKQVVMFGFSPKQLGLNIDLPLYNVVDFQGKKLLFVDNIAKIEQNTALKKALWECLQMMFLKNL